MNVPSFSKAEAAGKKTVAYSLAVSFRNMRLQEEEGNWKVETTTEKLAQRLGRSVKKARGGNIAYKWGHNNKFVRVVWEKRAE